MQNLQHIFCKNIHEEVSDIRSKYDPLLTVNTFQNHRTFLRLNKENLTQFLVLTTQIKMKSVKL